MARQATILLIASLALLSACARSVNVEQERGALMAADRAASESTTDLDKFLSYYDAEATVYPPGTPMVSGAVPMKEFFVKALSAPGTTVHWTPAKAVVAASGDIGYTTGVYKMTTDGTSEDGKYVATWKKTNGQWKMTEDIFNADTGMPTAPSAHAMMTPADVKWGDPPAVLTAGAKAAVLAGDPSKVGEFVMRLQLPAGYVIAPHWHPTDELVTVVSGTLAVGMGDKRDDKAAQVLPAGSFAMLPARMHHYAIAKTATVVQVNGDGPFALIYVDPADDPSKKAAK